MARLNDDAQWIIMLGLIISISIFFLALIVNESMLVGQTTAESVIDLPKCDVQDLRNEVQRVYERTSYPPYVKDDIKDDIEIISLYKKNAIVSLTFTGNNITIHYNNGVTLLDETIDY
ncbi:MAG TPA: hypothetical protein PLN56_09315 [Methanoregulaceae archaeon]|nr:MAG: hypothetical protein IPI71_05630 [Methanolinea sp.]HON82358.1 hypothetical protein [Methanoregulaceae archaeon]HPD11175.1 hypothetical protein [Methanoregulaceae archaeon]HRT16175.1 hypothetical protein [Methanoregulaceae archaeon]HRU31742.1 hypothetical protein [Methanoregulaceae archaeon]